MNPSRAIKVHVIGAGLVGTSVALKLSSIGVDVSVEDSSPQNAELARDLIQNQGIPTNPDIVLVAVSPDNAGEACSEALSRFLQSIVVDVTSAKAKVIAHVAELSDDLGRFVPSHPIAGREVGGPESAQGDLFEGRAWIITPLKENPSEVLQKVEELIRILGAVPHRMDPRAHDELFAKISHLPQILSTLMASALTDGGEGVALAGQGLRDVTRLAESNPRLWSQIILLNGPEIQRAIEDFRNRLTKLEEAIASKDSHSLEQIFDAGRSGRKLISGKHGGAARDYLYFRIVIEDKPGVLGQLFALCGEHGVNVEDLEIEHTPNQETGLITIAVSPHQAQLFSSVLLQHNWRFHQGGPTR